MTNAWLNKTDEEKLAYKKKISNTLKSKGILPPSRKGVVYSKETIQKRVEARKGYKHTPQTIMKIQQSRKEHYDLIGRTSTVRDILEATEKYRFWRMSVLVRDNFKCVKCGSNKKIQVNHKIALDHFIRVANGNIDLLLRFTNLFDINLGETLCFECHKKTDSFGRQNIYGLGEALKMVGRGYAELRNIYTGKVDRQNFTNMVVTTGKNALADRLIGTTTNNRGIITYCALGTGITAPVAGNTAMETELFRKIISVRSVSGNVATFQTFFTATEVTGTLTEAGLFGDGASGTAGSGTLFCRTLINRVKTASDTLTLVWTVTIG